LIIPRLFTRSSHYAGRYAGNACTESVICTGHGIPDEMREWQCPSETSIGLGWLIAMGEAGERTERRVGSVAATATARR
jgi:hypothetical protein